MDTAIFEMLSLETGKPIEELEREYDEFEILMDLFEERRDVLVLCALLSAMQDTRMSLILESVFMQGIQAYRDMMVENGVDVVGIEQEALKKLQ